MDLVPVASGRVYRVTYFVDVFVTGRIAVPQVECGVRRNLAELGFSAAVALALVATF